MALTADRPVVRRRLYFRGRGFGIVRDDSLYLCRTLAGLYVFYRYRCWQGALVSAALLAAGFFAKQTALMIAAPALAAGLCIGVRHAVMTGCLWLAMLAAG